MKGCHSLTAARCGHSSQLHATVQQNRMATEVRAAESVWQRHLRLRVPAMTMVASRDPESPLGSLEGWPILEALCGHYLAIGAAGICEDAGSARVSVWCARRSARRGTTE